MSMSRQEDICRSHCAGAGEGSGTRYLRNGEVSQANEVLTDGSRAPNPDSLSISEIHGEENTNGSDAMVKWAPPGKSQRNESLDLLPIPAFDEPCNNASRLIQQYSSDYQGNAGAYMLCNREDQYGQYFQYNALRTIEGRDENYLTPDFENRVFTHGYYPESYERTRLSRMGEQSTLGQMASSHWPTSPRGPYKNPLSGSIPATSSADPLSLSHAIHNASAISDTPHPVPIYNTSSLSTSAYSTHCPQSYIQAASQEKNNPMLDWGIQSQIQPAYSDITKTLATRQMPASVDESVLEIQPCSPVPPSVQPNVKGHVPGARKRVRAMNQISSNPTTAALAANPEGFKVSAKSAFTRKDHDNIQKLVAAMNDMSATEDNGGMIRSWNKLKVQKAAKVVHVCEDLLVTIKRAFALQDKPLSDHKRSSNQYPTFEIRFNAVYETLKTQKTVCKHLLEDPYLYQVVDDPVYASMRVTNNRRVNKGKKDAIEQGRKLMGLKGNGKGHPLVKQESLEIDTGEDDYEEEQAIGERSEKRKFSHRSQLKRPIFTELPSVLESIENDDFARLTKKARRTKSSKRRIDDAGLAEILANPPKNVSEGLELVKVEEKSASPYGNFTSENDLHGPLGLPLVHYFGSHETFNDNLYSVDHPSPVMNYGACPVNPYQNFDQPSYAVNQQQTMFPQSFNATKAGFPHSFDSYQEQAPCEDWLDQDFQI